VDYTNRFAHLSSNGVHRYELSRTWPRAGSLGTLYFVMLNPSTADGNFDDPTIKKCVGFADRNQYSAIRVFNLFSFRATDPRNLPMDGRSTDDTNDTLLANIPKDEDVVVAWGGNAYKNEFGRARVKRVLELLARDVFCVRQSNGRPHHPLYVPYGELQRFEVHA
jgi:hypothetical protein